MTSAYGMSPSLMLEAIKDIMGKGVFLGPNIQGSAGCNRDSFYSQRLNNNATVFNDARNVIPRDNGLSKRANALIDDLDYYINLYDIQFRLPKILVDVCSNEIYFEWIFAHFRIGMLIHENPSSDGWFIIGDSVMNGVDKKYGLDLEGKMKIAGIVSTYGNES